jgi:hypothetical protein
MRNRRNTLPVAIIPNFSNSTASQRGTILTQKLQPTTSSSTPTPNRQSPTCLSVTCFSGCRSAAISSGLPLRTTPPKDSRTGLTSSGKRAEPWNPLLQVPRRPIPGEGSPSHPATTLSHPARKAVVYGGVANPEVGPMKRREGFESSGDPQGQLVSRFYISKPEASLSPDGR